MLDRSYTDLALRQAMALLAIDSPTGFTEKAAQWVQTAFASLGYDAQRTAKGGVLIDLGGRDETDALLLENSLIKELQPRYNILLKDDKTYPWIVVRRENFPRIQSTRQLQRDGSQYFGPYSSVTMQHSILEFIREVIPLRTCSLNLAPEAIARGRYTVCLQYHLGNCKGPCIGAQSAEEYRQLLDMAVSVLKGDLRPVRAYLEGEMRRAAEALQFETAQRYKSRLAALENYSARSVIVSARIVDVDVFSLVEDDDAAYCNFLRIRILRALATAGLFGNVAKTNSSISGAEVGCQGEVGVACAMAAAAACQLFGGTPSQIEYAAEMGLEHHLGLTCDPVCGLVQVPCIERNAIAAARALDANIYATLSDGHHLVSYDKVVEVMNETGHNLPSLYRETSEGGLAKRYEHNK